MSLVLIPRRGPDAFPKARCHGCGKCFRPSRIPEPTRGFTTMRAQGRYYKASGDRNWMLGTAMRRRFRRGATTPRSTA